ncbi:MAG: acetyl-CoA carboxylase, carboxyltransferase subunit beta [Holosporales bacterium]|jgi:acetyl-CoA carboxylase carboxyl transferase subunit beta|nr:acetyl-CoA carboxylase, carboxyltransferase subunit beta [Holosporales bacterium]
MNWLTEFVRPKIQALMEKSNDAPEDLWKKCSKCEQMIFHLELHENLNVCPNCSYHMRLSTTERLNLLIDDQQYQMIPLPLTKDDPIQFKDSRRYADRLKEHRLKTKQHDVISVAIGDIAGIQAVVAVMNFEFMGGSMGMFVGKAFCAAVELAVSKRIPFVVVTASGGARMQEGMLSLMQMPATVIGVEKLHEARIPYVVVLTDPTMGGVSASFAMLGDVTLAEAGALIGFAGPRVIEETINQKLPEGFQRAEFLRDHGMVDIVVERKALKTTLGRILVCFKCDGN